MGGISIGPATNKEKSAGKIISGKNQLATLNQENICGQK
jgi:hypothetical protein